MLLLLAFALGAEMLPEPQEGGHWHEVAGFNAGDAILENASLKDVFKAAIKEGYAVVPS